MTDLVKQNEKLPAFLTEHEATGLDSLASIIQPPIVKIMQAQSRIEGFEFGDVVVPDADAPLMKKDGSMFVQPIFFYREFCKHSPWELKDKFPWIPERSLDPNSEVGRKCEAARGRYEEPIEGEPGYSWNYGAHLNFVCLIREPETKMLLWEDLVIFSFFSAEWKTGQRFANLIKQRRAAIFAGQYEFQLREQSNAKGVWLGWRVSNPADTANRWAISSDAEFDQYEEQWNELKKAYDSNILQADYETAVEGEVVSTEESEM